jgi:hypothetical protein
MGEAIPPFHNQPKSVAVDAVASWVTKQEKVQVTISTKGRKKRPIKTGLEIPVKLISDRGLTEEQYFDKIERIRQEEIQKRFDKLADEEVKKRNLPRLKNPPPPRRVARPVVRPRPQPIRGLLHPEEPKPTGFMGLLATTPQGDKA